MERKTYKAQALAISMVVLVVSSIIAISVYSRILKDQGLSVEERASAEALEVSDLLLDKLTVVPINTMISAIELITESPFDYSSGINIEENNNGKGDITELLTEIGINYNLSDMGFCKIADGNQYVVSIKEADENTPYEIRAGQVWSLPANGKSFSDDCSLSLKITKGDTNAGFLISKTYAKYNSSEEITEYREYDSDGMITYCFGDNGSECNNVNFLDSDNWQVYVPGNVINIPLNAASAPSGYELVDIRVKAISGNIGIAYTMGTNNSCIDGFRMIQVRAAAYCNGVYRGKEVLIPEKKWSNVLFDYVLFNGEGSM